MYCNECGNPMVIDGNGVANHVDSVGGIDHDQDAIHVAIAEPDAPTQDKYTIIKFKDEQLWALQGHYSAHEAVIVASSQALRAGKPATANLMLWEYQNLEIVLE